MVRREVDLPAEWVAAARGFDSTEVASALGAVEGAIGREWIEAQGISGMRCEADVQRILTMSKWLALIADAPGSEKLLGKLRKLDASAEIELRGLQALVGADTTISIVVEPEVPGFQRRPDFLLVRDRASVYVEVSRPLTSDVEKRLRHQMHSVIEAFAAVKAYVAIEVCLEREVTGEDLPQLTELAARLATAGRFVRAGVAGLGEIAVAPAAGATFPRLVFERDDGVRVAASGAPQAQGSVVQHVSVSIAYTDKRAESALRAESKQLPEVAPGIVVLDVTGLPGAMKAWVPLITRRLQPSLNRRVSAVVLVNSETDWESWPGQRLTIRALRNPHACRPLPDWLERSLIASKAL